MQGKAPGRTDDVKFVTIKDIARLAGVSHTTVSRVLNNKPGVKEGTRQRIVQVISDLEYEPNLVARSLVMKKSRTLGMVITTIRNPFYLELAQGIEDTARSFGYSVYLCCTNYDLAREEEHIKVLRRKGVDGIIVSSAHVNDAYIASVVEEDFPIVLVNRRVLEPDLSDRVDYIGVNNVKGGEIAVEHVVKMGRRRIGLITGNRDSSITVERMTGTRRVLERYGIPVDERLIFEGDFLQQSGYDGSIHFLSLKEPPDAVVSFNDYMALGVYDALMQHGVRVPDDIALVGFNDIEFASLQMVSLTTISQKKYVLGFMAVRRLMQRIAGEQAGLEWILEPELIIRRSCGYFSSGYSPSPP
jgi:LacI family transcriptional regulator